MTYEQKEIANIDLLSNIADNESMNNITKTNYTSIKRNETVQSIFSEEDAFKILCLLAKDGNNFAASLETAYRKWGLKPEQEFWMHKLAMQYIEKLSGVEKKPEGYPVPNLFELFENASSRLKFPKITFQFDTGKLQMRRTGERSKQPGVVYFTNGRKYGDPDNLYYGKMDREGVFYPGRNLDENMKKFILDFNDDPVKIAEHYGQTSGNCVFCQRTLTDDKSLKVGYGPVCADHFNLPYPDRVKKSETISEELMAHVLEIIKNEENK